MSSQKSILSARNERDPKAYTQANVPQGIFFFPFSVGVIYLTKLEYDIVTALWKYVLESFQPKKV